MVIVGDDGSHVLVQDIPGPIPVWSCWAPYQFMGRCLRTGKPRCVVVPLARAAEVLELPDRVLELVCRQDGELLLWDRESGRIFSVPEPQSSFSVADMPSNSPVWVEFYAGEPLWVWGPA
jgi:hypothetical protein